MATRLDRLFVLLESGSTQVIRKSAAEQLGEVQKLHPHEFHNLLSKVHAYLGNSNWETRIAAGQAIEAIAKNVPQWQPVCVKKEVRSEVDESELQLRFAGFDIDRVLVHGASLLASEGDQYDIEDDSEATRLDQKEILARQKQLLNKRLGLDIAGSMGEDGDDLVKEEDLVIQQEDKSNRKQMWVGDLVHQQMAPLGSTTTQSSQSARQKNRAKRIAKLYTKQISREASKEATNGDGSDSEHSVKRRKMTSTPVNTPGEEKLEEDSLVADNGPDNTLNMEEMEEWPFEAFCDLLMNDLFHASWEKRHGSATGLREVIKLHGKGAGKTTHSEAAQMEVRNQQWLEDVALRLTCVLALDRFGDYVSDEVVAPVRETCAQTLGVVLHHMSAVGVGQVLQVLLRLLDQTHWQVRHGGLLGIKYLLAVRQDVVCELLASLLPAVFKGIQDKDDDVRAVAASALLPVTDALVTTLPSQMAGIVQCLWDTLLDLDDLTASTNSIMTLLSGILSHPKVPNNSVNLQSLAGLVPRLWPFLRHNIVTVRKATLQTLHALLTRDVKTNGAWLLPILQDALRHIYQRALVETQVELLNVIKQVWDALLAGVPTQHLAFAAVPWLSVWLCLLMQPPIMPFDPTLLIEAKHTPKEQTPSRVRHAGQPQPQPTKETREYIGGVLTINEREQDNIVIRARTTAARLLGVLWCHLVKPVETPYPEGMEPPAENINTLVTYHLSNKSAMQRFAITMVVREWILAQQNTDDMDRVKTQFSQALIETIYFDEIAASFTKMQSECKNFTSCLKQFGTDIDKYIPPGSILSLEQAQALCSTVYDSLKDKLKTRHRQSMDLQRIALQNLVAHTVMEQHVLNTRVQASLAGAVILLHSIPDKLNPVIRPLMEALKKEENKVIQSVVGRSLSALLQQCRTRMPCPNPKVIKNLCIMMCCDPEFTPVVGHSSQVSEGSQGSDKKDSIQYDMHSGILTLVMCQKAAEKYGTSRRGPATKHLPTMSIGINVNTDVRLDDESESRRQVLIQRRGGMYALTWIVQDCGEDLPSKMSSLWDTITTQLLKSSSDSVAAKESSMQAVQDIVNNLQVLEVVAPVIHKHLHPQILSLLDPLCRFLDHQFTSVRHMASRCLGVLSSVSTTPSMNAIMKWVMPSIGASHSDRQRQGGIETLANVIEQLGVDVVPYIVLLIVPVMGCMSDQDKAVRLMATSCFATLIRLMPLEAGVEDPPDMDKSLIEKKGEERYFLQQLLDPTKIDHYKVPVPIKAQLRKYQQDGVNWLWFLNKYKLHGILCDDMGLGKTLQSICILAGDTYLRQQNYKETKAVDCTPLPSLVICPPTLTGHWVYEVEKFVTKEYLNPLHYTGPPTERVRLQKQVKKHNLVVASYDVVRNDVEFFASIKWNYVILDEGHIIKNSKTKLSKAVKQLRSNHRLILSGTPIQNNVLELWSLLDFLMPGLLGTERQFQVTYGRPILQSRDAKSSSKEQEAGALAMEALHRQVLPFLLRRMKEDVLQDLPPKIIQDYYCDLSSLQIQLYEDFAKSQARQSLDGTISDPDSPEKKPEVKGRSHIFQALQYLRKLCNHPALVLTPQHPKYEGIMSQLKQQGTSVRSTSHAPKLTALKQLLHDCGIGIESGEGADSLNQPVVNQHRVLLFCQLKAMLDIVEQDLLKKEMGNVTYLRLDGSVPAGSRHGIVNRFNNDPSIDVLLLTTHVGGLGLNLTGADTVIFVEHDWNPMKDLQAMDRAHRIGQKKVVNVYRLITRATLEEKIMGLQKFKMNIANTVISSENASLASMGTDQLLDLFSLDGAATSQTSSQGAGGTTSRKQSIANILESMDQLSDQAQYEQEFDLKTFMKTLTK